jgi:putative metallohydrolase (TIGR04338 family)
MKDSQRGKVYTAESELKKEGTRFTSYNDMVIFIEKIRSNAFLRRRYNSQLKRPIGLKINKGKRWAWGNADHITIPEFGGWAWMPSVVCHEVAHTITLRTPRIPLMQYQSHGRQFCAVYLNVVRAMMGREAYEELKANFKAHGVKFTPKKKSAPLTPERRQALAAILETARRTKQLIAASREQEAREEK